MCKLYHVIGLLEIHASYALKILMHWIHLTLNVRRVWSVWMKAESLVLDRSSWVQRLDDLKSRPHACATARFIAQRPDDYGWVVLVALHACSHARSVRPYPLRHVPEDIAHRTMAMRFDVCLINEVDAVLVAQLIPTRVVWIVARPHVVAVARLDEFEVKLHSLFADIVPGVRPMLVSVHSPKLDRHSIDHEHPAFDFDLPKSCPAGNVLLRSIGSVLREDNCI